MNAAPHYWDAVRSLRDWIKAHRPDLQAQLTGCPLNQCRHILNRETGLDISSDGDVNAGAQQYLAALQAQHITTT